MKNSIFNFFLLIVLLYVSVYLTAIETTREESDRGEEDAEGAARELCCREISNVWAGNYKLIKDDMKKFNTT